MKRVLVANRGEIALRIMRGCREAGMEVVAIHSDADSSAPHVVFADHAVLLTGDSPLQVYLDVDGLVQVALDAGADAVHPGYGFLAENAGFARAVEGAGLTFIGPTPDTIDQMGSKTEARTLMQNAGVPVVPGYQGPVDDSGVMGAAADEIGYPVLVKASFGGGGKGMRVVRSPEGLSEAIESAQREAKSAFGDSRVFLEKFVEGPSHVEVQILGDGKGGAVHVGERECSVQRRHQKVIEECPAAWVNDETRQAICDAGVLAAKAVNYRGAGTVEFLVERTGDFYFLEMNTRLQVEHPVTECVYGRDLVRAQLHIASTETLPFEQHELVARGHALEARIYAESPEDGFMPSIGELLRVEFPSGPGVRIDSGVREGMEISVHYDPMIAKLIVFAETRERALEKLVVALGDTVLHGVKTNVGLLQRICRSEAFIQNAVHTRWLDEEGAVLWEGVKPDFMMALAAWGANQGTSSGASRDSGVSNTASAPGIWKTIGGWKMSEGGLS
jgi:acetyl-CoA carboxylase biotin carboxylase subunit